MGDNRIGMISKDRKHFHGTHKGADILIERNNSVPDSSFYIQVRSKDGGLMYDGWAPGNITTIREAKKEAIRGAQL